MSMDGINSSLTGDSTSLSIGSDALTLQIIESGLTAIAASQSSVSGSSLSSDDIIEFLEDLDGTLSFDGGVLVSDLETPLGGLNGTFDLVEITSDFAASLTDAEGSLTIDDGVLVGEIQIGDDLLNANLNIADLATNFVTSVLTDLEGTVPFENGQIAIDAQTPFGEVGGTIDFGGGALVTDLTTPFGDFDFSIDFGDDAQIPLDFGVGTGLIDFASGLLTADLFPASPGPEVSIPLDALSGTIAFEDGFATVEVPVLLGFTLEASFDLAGEVGSFVQESLTALEGSFSLSSGILFGDAITSFGGFAVNLDLVELTNEVTEFLGDTSGTLAFENGILTSDLSTPLGDLDGTFNLVDLFNDVIEPDDALTAVPELLT